MAHSMSGTFPKVDFSLRIGVCTTCWLAVEAALAGSQPYTSIFVVSDECPGVLVSNRTEYVYIYIYISYRVAQDIWWFQQKNHIQIRQRFYNMRSIGKLNCLKMGRIRRMLIKEEAKQIKICGNARRPPILLKAALYLQNTSRLKLWMNVIHPGMGVIFANLRFTK